jgi:AmmeMemoRadiSam system protein A
MTIPEKDGALLLKIARSAIEACLGGASFSLPDVKSPALKEKRGAFVTIYDGTHLRGCIGTFSAQKPLYETVVEMAVSSATRDPRFLPLTLDELPGVRIEISALTPLKRTEGVEEIEVGRHGLYIARGVHRGALLPQVAVEYGFDREEFLYQACLKAGLPSGCRGEGVEIYIFEAEVFGQQA